MGVAKQPTKEDFLEVLRRTTPEDYHKPIEDDPNGSIAVFRAFARIWEIVSQKLSSSAQSSFYTDHSLAQKSPATSKRFATFDCDIERISNLQNGVFVQAGGMRLAGPRGRFYTNSADVEWIPFDAQNIKTVSFEAEIGGFVANLDHIADANGEITDKEGNPDTTAVNFDDESRGRAGVNGTLLIGDGNGKLKDTGISPVFEATDVGLFVRISVASNPANVGRVLRILSYEQPGIEEPVGSGVAPRIVELDDRPVRTRLKSAQADDGGVFTNETVAANEESPDDMTLVPAVPATSDAYFIGSETVFSSANIDVSTVGADFTITWKYFDGVSFVAFPGTSALVDGTASFTNGGQNAVTFDPPVDWAKTTVNAVEAFYIKAEVTAVGGAPVQALGRQTFTGNPDRLLAEPTDGIIAWQLLSWPEVGFKLNRIEAADGGRDDDLFLLGGERGVFQRVGESDAVFSDRASKLADTVSPNALQRAANQPLAPFGFRARWQDVGPDTDFDFLGAFLDSDFFDYYEPGDVFPAENSRLMLNLEETVRFYFVFVPILIAGEFGAAFDDGPSIRLADGTDLDSAFDIAFFDGFPAIGQATYKAIFDALDRIDMGGVRFSLFLDDTLNDAVC